MPRGIYKRTKKIRDAIRRARLGCKASIETRIKQSTAARKRACDPAWLRRVSEGTRKKMRLPHVRKKHLSGLKRARELHGVNFKGGNGELPVTFVRDLWRVLKPIGYKREHAIGVTKKISHQGCYKVDFALVERKIAIECDGPKHRSVDQQKLDVKKDAILHILGWKVIRVRHD